MLVSSGQPMMNSLDQSGKELVCWLIPDVCGVAESKIWGVMLEKCVDRLLVAVVDVYYSSGDEFSPLKFKTNVVPGLNYVLGGDGAGIVSVIGCLIQINDEDAAGWRVVMIVMIFADMLDASVGRIEHLLNTTRPNLIPRKVRDKDVKGGLLIHGF